MATNVKMSVNLSPQVVEALRALAEKRNVTVAEVLRQAVSTEKYVDEVTSNEGKLLVEDKTGKVREIVFR